MDVLVLIDKLDDVVHNARPVPLTDQVRVDREEIYDLLAIRVLVTSVPDCYHALGIIHEGWTPVQERIKDYVAQPKSNGYQSLHTTVIGPGRQLYEVQIRTKDMHRFAEAAIDGFIAR